jgi:hypothetical protein
VQRMGKCCPEWRQNAANGEWDGGAQTPGLYPELLASK